MAKMKKRRKGKGKNKKRWGGEAAAQVGTVFHQPEAKSNLNKKSWHLLHPPHALCSAYWLISNQTLSKKKRFTARAKWGFTRTRAGNWSSLNESCSKLFFPHVMNVSGFTELTDWAAISMPFHRVSIEMIESLMMLFCHLKLKSWLPCHACHGSKCHGCLKFHPRDCEVQCRCCHIQDTATAIQSPRQDNCPALWVGRTAFLLPLSVRATVPIACIFKLMYNEYVSHHLKE